MMPIISLMIKFTTFTYILQYRSREMGRRQQPNKSNVLLLAGWNPRPEIHQWAAPITTLPNAV